MFWKLSAGVPWTIVFLFISYTNSPFTMHVLYFIFVILCSKLKAANRNPKHAGEIYICLWSNICKISCWGEAVNLSFAFRVTSASKLRFESKHIYQFQHSPRLIDTTLSGQECVAFALLHTFSSTHRTSKLEYSTRSCVKLKTSNLCTFKEKSRDLLTMRHATVCKFKAPSFLFLVKHGERACFTQASL